MKKLTKNERECLNFSHTQHIGTMRIDWVNDGIANSWYAKEAMKHVDDELKELIQQEINELMFNCLQLFDQVLDWCGGSGYVKEQLLYHEGIKANYYLRLIPVQDSTSAIYVYLK